MHLGLSIYQDAANNMLAKPISPKPSILLLEILNYHPNQIGLIVDRANLDNNQEISDLIQLVFLDVKIHLFHHSIYQDNN
jgi:hypothetical protein